MAYFFFFKITERFLKFWRRSPRKISPARFSRKVHLHLFVVKTGRYIFFLFDYLWNIYSVSSSPNKTCHFHLTFWNNLAEVLFDFPQDYKNKDLKRERQDKKCDEQFFNLILFWENYSVYTSFNAKLHLCVIVFHSSLNWAQERINRIVQKKQWTLKENQYLTHRTSFPRQIGWSSCAHMGDRWPAPPGSSVQYQGSTLPRRRCPQVCLPSRSSSPCPRQDSRCRSSCWDQWWRLGSPSWRLELARVRPGIQRYTNASKTKRKERKEKRQSVFFCFFYRPGKKKQKWWLREVATTSESRLAGILSFRLTIDSFSWKKQGFANIACEMRREKKVNYTVENRLC